jgi:hypothetical protein
MRLLLLITIIVLCVHQLKAQIGQPTRLNSIGGGFLTDNYVESNNVDAYRTTINLDYGRMKSENKMIGYRFNFTYRKFNTVFREYQIGGFTRYYNFLTPLNQRNRLGYFLESYSNLSYSPDAPVFLKLDIGLATAIYYSLSPKFNIEYTFGYAEAGYGFANNGNQITFKGNLNLLNGRLALRYFF